MRENFANRFRHTPAVLAVCGGLVLLGGCVEDAQQTTLSHSSPLAAPDDFATGRDRPPTARTLYQMARVLSAQGKDPQAIAVLRSSIARYETFLPSYVELAHIQARAENHDDAAATLESAIAVGPEHAVLHNELGLCRMMSEDHESARHAFAQAVNLEPDNTRYVANHALATGMAGYYDDAVMLYENVMEPAQAHYNVAVICEALHDYESAERHYAISNNGGELPEEWQDAAGTMQGFVE